MAAPYERRWVAEPVIGMPTTILVQSTVIPPPPRSPTLPPKAPRKSTPTIALSYERQWIPGPKIGMPTTVVVESTVIPPPRSPSPPPKAPKRFIPALPSNPRPTRRASEDINNTPRDARPVLLSRATTSATRPYRRTREDDDFPPQDARSRRPNRATSTATRMRPTRIRSILKSPKLTRRLTSEPPTLPPLRIPSPESRKNADTASAPAERTKAVAFPKDVVLSDRIIPVTEEAWPLPQDVVSPQKQTIEAAEDSLPSSQDAVSPQMQTTEAAEMPTSPQAAASSQEEVAQAVEENPISPQSIVSPQEQMQAEKIPTLSTENPVFSLGEIVKAGENSMPPLPDFGLPNLQFQEPLYLRIIDIPPSQRSSDTMPAGFSLEATNEVGEIMSVSPVEITPSTMLESLGASNLPSPPSSGDESSPRTPLTPVIQNRPNLQPAPLSLKTQATDSVFIEDSNLTPPAKTPTPPPEASLPAIPDSQLTNSPPKHGLSIRSKPLIPKDTLRRKPSNATYFGPLAPRSLTTHLLALENTPRKLYLATNSPFLLSISTSKANVALLSSYLSQERLYLHSTLRLLSLLLANVILPIKPSGLISQRRGGVRDRLREETDKQERDRQAQAQKSQKDFGPGMGANFAVEVAAGTANLGMGMVLGGIVGIGTGFGMKTALGAAGVGLSNLGNSASDQAGEEEMISEAIENVHKDVGERAVGFLIAAIARTRNTLDLFEEVGEDIPGIDLDGEQERGEGGEMSALTMFSRLFGEIGGAVEKREKSVLAGLVMLYAREKAHLDSWLEVKATLSTRPQTRPVSVSLSQNRKSDFDEGAIRLYLLPEFTSDESVSYVENLGRLVDDLWADKYVNRDEDRRFLERRDLAEKKRKLRGGDWESEIRLLEGLFEMVLDIQGRFWPVC